MTTAEPEEASRRPISARNRILDALAFSSPAFYFACASAFATSGTAGIALVVAGLVLLLCLTTGIAHTRLADAGAATALDGLNFARSRSAGSNLVGFGFRWASGLCHWIVPGLWLYLASFYLSDLIHEVWSTAPVGSLWIMIPSAAILALLLTYLPACRVGLVLPVLAGVEIVAVIALSIVFVAHHDSAPAKSHFYTLDSEGNPIEQDSAPDAAPADNTRTYFASAADVPTPVVPAERYAIATGCIAAFSLALWAFIAALGQGAKYKRPGFQVLAMFVLIVVQCAGLLLAEHVYKERAAESTSGMTIPTGSPPVSDMLQIAGAWAFGSARAGWWVMVSQLAILLLVLIAAARISLISQIGCGAPAAKTHSRTLVRAGTSVAICDLAAWGSAYATQLPAGAAFVSTSTKPAQLLPDFPSTLLLVVSLAVVALASLICVVSAANFRGRSPARRARLIFLPRVIGLIIGVACIAFTMIPPLMFRGESAKELLWALSMCGIWGVVQFWLEKRARLIFGALTGRLHGD